MFLEGNQGEAGESDGPVAGVGLWSRGDASLAGDLMGLADDRDRAVQQVEVPSLQPEELTGPQTGKSPEQYQAPESRFDRFGELQDRRRGEHGSFRSMFDAGAPDGAGILGDQPVTDRGIQDGPEHPVGLGGLITGGEAEGGVPGADSFGGDLAEPGSSGRRRMRGIRRTRTELAPLIDAELVATAVASAIGAPPSPTVEPTEVACRFLAHKRALVVLDNCEHVIEAAADLVDQMLSAAPRARVLATSREPLDVGGESVWRVPSLTVEVSDGEIGDAVALFVERAGQVVPGFALDDTNRDPVAQVCRRLDGIPLAFELAAARAKVMSVEQIATRLDERFRLLTRGGRTAVARQQTLQGAID